MCGCADGRDSTDMRDFAGLFVVSKSLAVATLGVWVDVEVFFKTAVHVEKDEMVDAQSVDCPVARDGEDHK